ncbi:MAG: PD-(D/E)XK nuclease family protein [Desulfovibrio sp.]|nr:PD-(D/E)XK nuclease family protein [Desulfovibrio sp.]
MRTKFRLFSWTRPFLPALKDELKDLTNGRPGNALVIVPHQRPRRYLYDLYKESGRSGTLPMLYTVTDVMHLLHATFAGQLLKEANPLDRVWLLHECVRKLGKDDESLGKHFADMDIASFLPWGMRLAGLLEEMLIHGVKVQDIAGMEYDVGPHAAALLGSLGRIAKAYLADMNERGWWTHGMDYAAACGEGELPSLLKSSPGSPVVIAGFYQLSKTEDHVLRRLWEEGAIVCLHTEIEVPKDSAPHMACAAHVRWMRRWGVGADMVERIPKGGDTSHEKPEIRFFQGSDVHTQLDGVRNALKEGIDSTVIVLNDDGMLVPLLHHLPKCEVNISMGYPLGRSLLCQFIENLLRLYETAQEGDWLHWRSLLRCLRHPFLKMLTVQNEQGVTTRLGTALREMERKVKSGERFVSLELLVDDVVKEKKMDETAAGPFREVMETIFLRLAKVRNIREMSEWLLGICDLLSERGDEVWGSDPEASQEGTVDLGLERSGDAWWGYLLDSEALYRLRTQIVPVLAGSGIANEAFEVRNALFELLRELIAKERVPFEADPLTGLQVMGLLETRMLHFDRVLVVEATDGRLPGAAPTDPLLPQSLRQVLGLPDVREREGMTAHALFRLCTGAKDVRFFWEEGGSGTSQIMDGRNVKSRFVERCIWEAEREQKKLLEAGDSRLEVAQCMARPYNRPEVPSLKCTGALREKLDEVLSLHLSPSALDDYLRCPLAFARRRLDGLSSPDEVNEGDDPAAVGTCVHSVLEQLFSRFAGKKVCPARDISRKYFDEVIDREISQSEELHKKLPPASCFMLEAAARYRIWRYLQSQKNTVTLLELERWFDVDVPVFGRNYLLRGKLDRIEKREEDLFEGGLLYILDYKTGTVHPPSKELWSVDGVLFPMIETLGKDSTPEDYEPVLQAMRDNLHSLQLPCYVLMLAGKYPARDIGGACFVSLKEDGKEVPLFPFAEVLEAEAREAVVKNCEKLVATVIGSLASLEVFNGVRGDGERNCKYCDYACMCF